LREAKIDQVCHCSTAATAVTDSKIISQSQASLIRQIIHKNKIGKEETGKKEKQHKKNGIVMGNHKFKLQESHQKFRLSSLKSSYLYVQC